MSHHQEHSLEQDLTLAKEWSKPEFLPPDQEPGKGNGWRHTCYRLAKYIEDHIQTQEALSKSAGSQPGEPVWIIAQTLTDCYSVQRRLLANHKDVTFIRVWTQMIGQSRPVTVFMSGKYTLHPNWENINNQLLLLQSKNLIKEIIRLP